MVKPITRTVKRSDSNRPFIVVDGCEVHPTCLSFIRWGAKVEVRRIIGLTYEVKQEGKGVETWVVA